MYFNKNIPVLFISAVNIISVANGQTNRTDLFAGKSENDFIEYVLPYFSPSKGFTTDKETRYDREINAMVTEYTLSKKEIQVPISVIIAKGKVWCYSMVVGTPDIEQKNKFATNIKKSKTFQRVSSGIYKDIETGEIKIFSYMKDPNRKKGYMFLQSFLGTSNPNHLESVKQIIENNARELGLSVEIIE